MDSDILLDIFCLLAHRLYLKEAFSKLPSNILSTAFTIPTNDSNKILVFYNPNSNDLSVNNKLIFLEIYLAAESSK